MLAFTSRKCNYSQVEGYVCEQLISESSLYTYTIEEMCLYVSFQSLTLFWDLMIFSNQQISWYVWMQHRTYSVHPSTHYNSLIHIQKDPIPAQPLCKWERPGALHLSLITLASILSVEKNKVCIVEIRSQARGIPSSLTSPGRISARACPLAFSEGGTRSIVWAGQGLGTLLSYKEFGRAKTFHSLNLKSGRH